MIPIVHANSGGQLISRRSAAGGSRVRPLNEPDIPLRPAGSTAVDMLHVIINWLEVDRRDTQGNYRNLRWAPDGNTYCNIYAYDYAFLACAALPRLWWTPAGRTAFGQGAVGFETDYRGMSFITLTSTAYGIWLTELNANALQPWFASEGPNYGWTSLPNAEEAQAAANSGRVVVWSGAKRVSSQHGHITAVVPETSVFRAERDSDGKVVTPIQSQAGASNLRYHTRNLFVGPSWKAVGFYVHG